MLNQNTFPIQVINGNRAVSMSSIDIADLVGSRHDSVKRTIERLVNQGVIELPPMVEIPTATKPTTTYLFCGEKGKRDSIVVVAQLSPEFTARLVDRWQELESKNFFALPNFNNPAEAARAWADQVEAKQAAVLQLEAAKPAVQFVDKYVDATGLKTFREVCKLMQVNEHRFRDFMANNRIMYRLNKKWMPYQSHIDAGRFSLKTGVIESNGHAFADPYFTPKGINWIAGLWNETQKQGEVA